MNEALKNRELRERVDLRRRDAAATRPIAARIDDHHCLRNFALLVRLVQMWKPMSLVF